jgi:hypothetical protein
MTYIFTLPNPMRVFKPVNPGAKLLRRTDRIISSEEVVKISAIVVASYDHTDKLALKLDENDSHLLVEEIDDEIRELAYQWTAIYEETQDEGAAHAAVHEKLAPLLQKYIERLSQVAFNKKGPGIHFVF